MTVAELIQKLQEFPPDAEVILQGDPEGNWYTPLREADADAYYAAGEVYPGQWSANDALMDQEEWDHFKANTPKCCVLAP